MDREFPEARARDAATVEGDGGVGGGGEYERRRQCASNPHRDASPWGATVPAGCASMRTRLTSTHSTFTRLVAV